MKEEIQKLPASSDPAVNSGLNVEIKIRERDTDAVESIRESEEAVLAVAQGWMARGMVLLAVLSISAIYVVPHIGDGWVPADDGTLSQSAWRVMQGQLPHRDFAEIYTGGLSLIHALAFRAFGVSLMALRFCAFLFFLLWIPAVYYIALRFTSAIGAGLITLAAVAWSFPNYPAAMPSWYNLFLATFGAAALLRYLDVRRSRWLFVAGICGGASLLIKVTGSYYIAGVLLFLAFLEQTDREPNDIRQNSLLYRGFSIGALLLFLATVMYAVHARLGSAEFYHFVMPSMVLAGVIAIGETNSRTPRSGERFKKILRLVIPFACGVASPVAAFLLPYIASGAVTRLLSGVTASVMARSSGLAILRPAGIDKGIFAAILVALIAAALYAREFHGKLVMAAVGVGLTVLLLKAPASSEVTSGVWFSVAMLTPLVVLTGAILVAQAGPRYALAKLQRQRAMALICLAALCSLVQYPFAAPIYLCYCFPLTLLAAASIVATAENRQGKYVLAAIAGFYMLFGVVMLVPDHLYELTHKVGDIEELQLERAAGLRIENAATFAELVHFLQQHSPNGLLYAGNDCPELYFLSGLKNVTRHDDGAPAQDVLTALQSDELKVIVINEAPFFPLAKMNPEVREEVMQKFPHSNLIGIFRVFWRE